MSKFNRGAFMKRMTAHKESLKEWLSTIPEEDRCFVLDYISDYSTNERLEEWLKKDNECFNRLMNESSKECQSFSDLAELSQTSKGGNNE